ncbi:hypothetical protein [Anaeromicrobium sediminis]|uniref:Uncharacterized protein n=1 Tax=Anaeromicrobium sediminis TaxID=1478221 RepID=A0A267M9H7_9FIRM|nr:hypothetical protein [Anaeromicrobium sediminis]PAB55463.1 hypothetical protein CCE28_21735 [Anaeromicrobium sediminis]
MQTWNIKNLSGDSTVENIKYSNGVVTCIYDDYDLEKRFSIDIVTDVLYSQGVSEKGSVHVRILDLSKYVPINQPSGIYVFPKDFGQQMKLVRNGLHLVLGKKQKEYPYFLQIRGYKILLACPIKSIEDVKVTLIKE